jgi:hypothetical protein
MVFCSVLSIELELMRGEREFISKIATLCNVNIFWVSDFQQIRLFFFFSLGSTNSSVIQHFLRFVVVILLFVWRGVRERRVKEKMLQRRRNGGVKEGGRDSFIINKALGLL